MPLGEFFSCVWLVLLALHLMTTFPSRSYCNSHSATPELLLPKSSSSSSSESLPSQPEQNSDTAAISTSPLCHHSIDTSELISADCQQIQREPRMRITGEVSEGPGPPSCPAPCPKDEGRAESPRSDKNLSCYRYLVPKDCISSGPNDWASIRLRHCCEHTVYEALPNAAASLTDQEKCQQNVKQLLELDAFVAKVTCQFEQVLSRYDCQQNYSVNNCQNCKAAYRRWVCASLIPHWRERHKIKPCRSICHAVEQNCPWFLPAEKIPGYPAQYAGEPIFQCIDSNIPETGEQLVRSTYGSGCCYEYCPHRRHSNTLNHGYQQSESSHLPVQMIPCVKGCNDTFRDPSQNAKIGASMPCTGPPSSSSSSSTTTASSNDRFSSKSENSRSNVPLVNFPLSSCPSADSSSTSAKDKGLKSAGQRHSTNTVLSNLLIIWYMFCLFYNVNLSRWR